MIKQQSSLDRGTKWTKDTFLISGSQYLSSLILKLIGSVALIKKKNIFLDTSFSAYNLERKEENKDK